MKDKLLNIGIVLGVLFVLSFIGYFIVKEIEDLRIDHKCYMMEDEEFYNTEVCKLYWKYRQEEKNE